MPMILLAVVGSSNQSNTIKMMSLFWWGALTNQIGNLKFEAYFEVLCHSYYWLPLPTMVREPEIPFQKTSRVLPC